MPGDRRPDHPLTVQTRRDRRSPVVSVPLARALLHAAKADGSETLVIGRVSVTCAEGGAEVGSLSHLAGLEWPNGYGLVVDPASFAALKAECAGRKPPRPKTTRRPKTAAQDD